MYRSVLYLLCAIVLVWVESFPLDEDVCENNNNYFGNLQAYNSDELELLEDACPAPRGFNRREIPVRFRKPISEYEKIEKARGDYEQDMYLDKKQNEDESNESNNSMIPKNRLSKYSQESYERENKFCHRPKTHHKFNSFHQKSKRKYSKYDSDCSKFAGAKSYRIPPFETFYKSYSQYGGPGMKELNTEDIVEKQPQSMELDIKEEIIDKPTDVVEIKVERVVQETNETSADNNEEKLKQDDEDNHEASGESDDEEQDETEEEQDEIEKKDMNANSEKIIVKKQKINEDKTTTENTQLQEGQTTINV